MEIARIGDDAATGAPQGLPAALDPLGERRGVLPAEPFLVLCACVRDEQDILDAFLAFHLSQGVDLVLIFDHASQDGTRAILDWYAANEPVAFFHGEGVRLQGKWMTAMALLATTAGATWIINADADEFWMPRYGTLRDTFRALPEGVSRLRAFPRDFLPPRSGGGFDFETQTTWDANGAASYYNLGKLKPKTAHRASSGAVVHGGNHSVTGVEGPIFGGVLIDILHFPVRSFEQFERKIAVRFTVPGGPMIGPTGKLGTYPGDHYRRFNELRVSGELRSDFDDWLAEGAISAGVAEGRFVVDDRLARHLRGLRKAGRVSSMASPQGFARSAGPSIDSSNLVDREVRLCTSMMRASTLQLRGQIKDLRRELKRLRTPARTSRVVRRRMWLPHWLVARTPALRRDESP